MSDCYSQHPESSTQRYPCPACGRIGKPVSIKTILHQIKQPWLFKQLNKHYFFCAETVCDVVYFVEDNLLIRTNDLRQSVGLKDQTEQAILCYCFAISVADAKKNPALKQFVLDKTENKLCACEIRNPSGKCCLKDFP